MSRSFTAPPRRAFTLIEVLTATSIMVVLLFVVISIAANTFTAYDSAISKLTTASESRSVLGALEQDLQSAIIRNDGNVWLEVYHDKDVDNVKQAYAPQLMLFAAAPDRPKREGASNERIGGDVCAISYQIAHRSPFANPGDFVQQIYGLYRAVADAKATFDTALPIITGSNGDLPDKPSKFWRESNADVLDMNGNRSSQKVSDWVTQQLNFQASNVIELKFIFWYYDTAEKKTVLFAQQEVANEIGNLLRKAGVSEVNVLPYSKRICFKAGKVYIDEDPASESAGKDGFLKRVDVFTTLLSPAGAKMLGGYQQGTNAGKIDEQQFKDLVEKEGYSFSTSITFSR